ncbi:MAG TPA: SDR family oxidoreductase [Saprospiraceae bacterium]|nr:SDR family oxidoreductase [Saprospiraceae bacterium]
MNAIITGATKGIGRALAETMWREGYSLAVCARSKKDLEEMADAMQPAHPEQRFLWRPTDVSDRNDLRAFSEFVENAWDVVDVLVNNAGIFKPGEVLHEEEGLLDQMLRTNLYSAYDLTRAMFPLLQKSKRGHVFTMCSIASILAYPNGGSYTISKFGLLGFTKVLREELKPLGIKVTAVIAGATWSDSWKGVDYPESRLMQASDVTEAVMSALRMSPSAVVEEILIRPQLGDL